MREAPKLAVLTTRGTISKTATLEDAHLYLEIELQITSKNDMKGMRSKVFSTFSEAY